MTAQTGRRGLMDGAAVPIGGAVNPLIAVVGLLATMVLAVVASMVVENWRHLVRPVPALEAPVAATAEVAIGAALVEGRWVDDPGDHQRQIDEQQVDAQQVEEHLHDASDPAPAVVAGRAAPFDLPAAGRPEGALDVTRATISIRDEATADVLAGLLFAGLAASRRSGSDRAAAWVTATGTPPTADPERYPAGVRLRGRPGKVAALLEHRDGGVTWVGLQPGVDIARGLARTPVTQPTLAGLVDWWRCTRELPGALDARTAGAIAAAIDTVRPQLDETPWSRVVGRLHDALADAAADDRGVVVAVATAPVDPDRRTTDGPVRREPAIHAARDRAPG